MHDHTCHLLQERLNLHFIVIAYLVMLSSWHDISSKRVSINLLVSRRAFVVSAHTLALSNVHNYRINHSPNDLYKDVDCRKRRSREKDEGTAVVASTFEGIRSAGPSHSTCRNPAWRSYSRSRRIKEDACPEGYIVSLTSRRLMQANGAHNSAHKGGIIGEQYLFGTFVTYFVCYIGGRLNNFQGFSWLVIFETGRDSTVLTCLAGKKIRRDGTGL